MFCDTSNLLEICQVALIIIMTRGKSYELTETEELLKQTTGNQAATEMGKGKRNGVLNFMGELSKILFGTMDEADARYCNGQIKLFQQNAEDTTTLMN
jgi:hypothetical protein